MSFQWRLHPAAENRLSALHEELPAGHPPCFGQRKVWVDYLEHVVMYTRQSHADGLLRFERGGKVALNPKFDYCEDCTPRKRRSAVLSGTCNPHFLDAVLTAK